MDNYYVCDMSQVNLNDIGNTQRQPGIYYSIHNALLGKQTIYGINAKMDSMIISPMLITNIEYRGNSVTILCIIAMRECSIDPNDTITVVGMWGEYAIADDIAY